MERTVNCRKIGSDRGGRDAIILLHTCVEKLAISRDAPAFPFVTRNQRTKDTHGFVPSARL